MQQTQQKTSETNIPAGQDAARREHQLQPRRYERKAVQIPVHLEVNGNQITCRTQDFSPGGLQLLSDIALPPGTTLDIKFFFGNVCYLNVSGQTVFSLDQNGRKITGIKFSPIRDWEQLILLSGVKDFTESPTPDVPLMTIVITENRPASERENIPKYSKRRIEGWKVSPQFSRTHAAKIIGWGSYLPAYEITNQDINSMVTVNGARTRFGDVVGQLTGIRSRRYAASNVRPSDLAVEASRIALKNAGIEPKDLEVIISCGVARDTEEPATAYIIQEKLGAYNAYCFDLANACNGFISAIDVLDSFIASGRCELGLVAVGEVLSQYITWSASSKKDLHLSSMGYTLGDGGGAAILQRIKNVGDERGIHARWFLSDGSYWRVAVVPLIDSERRYFKSNAANIEAAALEHVPNGVEKVMKALNWGINDIALIIPHQVSFQIIENLFYRRLNMPREKIYWSFPSHGNIGAASMPVALCAALDEGRLKPGDKALLVGGSGGFGAGVIGLVI